MWGLYPYWRVPNNRRETYFYSVPFRVLDSSKVFAVVQIKSWSAFLLKNVYVNYPESVAGNVQSNQDLKIEIMDRGKNAPLTNNPLPVTLWTTPGGISGPGQGGDLNWVVAANAILQIIVSGQVGGLPADASVTLHGLHERTRF